MRLRPATPAATPPADHIECLTEAIAELPAAPAAAAGHPDGAGASTRSWHHLSKLATRPRPAGALLDRFRPDRLAHPHGDRPAARVRRSRARARAGAGRADADVAELTALLRRGPDKASSPAGRPMRVIVRREPISPGAPIRCAQQHTGGGSATRDRHQHPRGGCHWLEARHRVHARVEDTIPHRQLHHGFRTPCPAARLRHQHRLVPGRRDRLRPARPRARLLRPGRPPRHRRTRPPCATASCTWPPASIRGNAAAI